VVMDYPLQLGPEAPEVFVFIREGKRWLIDETVPIAGRTG
jgi:hypothetical protein